MSKFERRCSTIPTGTNAKFHLAEDQENKVAEIRKRKRKKKKYRMKKGLKFFLSFVLLTSLCSGGYYLTKHYNLQPALGFQMEKPKEQIQIIDTSSVYLYSHEYVNGNLEIIGMILNPELQYKTSQFQVIGADLYIRIQVEPNPDKKIKEFGFKLPCDTNKIKKIYLQGSVLNDKSLKWQNP